MEENIINQELQADQAIPIYPPKAERGMTGEEKMIRDQFPLFTAAAALYALFYTVCLYRNRSGITSPFFAAGTLFYLYFCIKRFGVPFKRDSILYMAAVMLLGISNFLTGDSRIVAMNYIGIFLLLASHLIHLFYDDGSWSFAKYFTAIGALILECIVGVCMAFNHFADYFKRKGERKKNSKVKYVMLGILISIPLLLVIMALLISADRIFEEMIVKLFKNIAVPQYLAGVLIMTLFVFFTAYGGAVALARRNIPAGQPDRRTQEPVIANTVTVLLSAVYILFSAVQICGLFLGAMKLPQEYTFAGYAREGFFQLLMVCVINLMIVLICLGYFKDHLLLKINLTVISFCTYIMIASSAYRMLLYIKEYHFTFLRLFVLWSLALISVIMAGVVLSIYKNKFPFFRFAMAAVTVFYLGFSFSHPDYWIARYNIKAFTADSEAGGYTGYADYNILELSSDAAPAIDGYEHCFESYSYSEYQNRIQQMYSEMNLRDFNLSRYLAGKVTE